MSRLRSSPVIVTVIFSRPESRPTWRQFPLSHTPISRDHGIVQAHVAFEPVGIVERSIEHPLVRLDRFDDHFSVSPHSLTFSLACALVAPNRSPCVILVVPSSFRASSKKVKASELNFPINSASPNSRILSLAPDAATTASGSSKGPLERRPSTLAASSAASSASDADSTTRRPPSVRRASSQTSIGKGSAAATTAAAAAGAGAAAAANGRNGYRDTAADLSDSDESSNEFEEAIEDPNSSSEEREELVDEADKVRPRPGRRSSGAKKRTGPMSAAAKIANDKMEENVKTRNKLGKPLSQLTAQDVALTEADVKEDIAVVWKAMSVSLCVPSPPCRNTGTDKAWNWSTRHLFLSSRMIEAEDICLAACDHRLYYSVGYSLIQVIKSLATFEPEDLEAAIQCCRDSIHITQLLRKKDHGLFERVGSIAKGSTSVNSIRAMTLVQRHAELIFAECTLLKVSRARVLIETAKTAPRTRISFLPCADGIICFDPSQAVLGIIYSGDFIAFLKEALNMRNAYAIYRTLANFVEAADASYFGEGTEDPSIDEDFRSGVRLGNGMISLILSLLPATVLKIMSVFGFSGDREWALSTLMAAGGWQAGEKEPKKDPAKEGIRKPICDMVLLMHHLVISNFLPSVSSFARSLSLSL